VWEKKIYMPVLPHQRERRNSERLSLRLACLLHELKDKQHILKLYTRDISNSGAFFYIDRPLTLDTEVEMVISLCLASSGPGLTNASGKVIRSDKKGIGVRFKSRIDISGVPQQHQRTQADIRVSRSGPSNIFT
jgi:hypothetical protein